MKSVDDELDSAGSCRAGSRKFGEVRDHVLFIVGKTLDIVFLENKSSLVAVGIECDEVRIVLYFDFLRNFCDSERDR